MCEIAMKALGIILVVVVVVGLVKLIDHHYGESEDSDA